MSFGERWLDNPKSWFGKRSEIPCGDVGENLFAAGGSYRCQGLSSDQARTLRRRYGTADTVSPQFIELQFCQAPPGDFLPLDPSIREYTFDIESRPDDVLLAGWGFAARIELRPRIAATVWTPHSDGEIFDSAFANIFRVVVAHSLVASGGALLHSAAVADGDSAQLFVGVSGAGKSTISRLALETGRMVLSDDLNAVWPDGGRPHVEQVPFTGELRGSCTTTGRFPVTGVFRLRQGSAAKLRPMTGAETLALLLGCAPFVNSDPYRRERLLANLEAFSRDIPANELIFPRAGDFWHLVSPGRAS